MSPIVSIVKRLSSHSAWCDISDAPSFRQMGDEQQRGGQRVSLSESKLAISLHFEPESLSQKTTGNGQRVATCNLEYILGPECYCINQPYLCLGWWAMMMFAFHLFHSERRWRRHVLFCKAFGIFAKVSGRWSTGGRGLVGFGVVRGGVARRGS